MQEHSPAFDCALFFTYLYFTSWSGLASVRVPSILQPTAHDESSLHYPHFDGVFQLADAFAFSTREERDLVLRRFATYRPSAVIGIGIDVDRSVDQVAFRRRFGLDDRPYVVSIGRIDSAKGSPELHRDFVRYKARHPGPLALVMIGQEVYKLPPHADVVKTGFVEEAVRNSGIAGALAMIQPSPFESFSLVLCEAWALERPAMVQRRSAVLVGHARRSGAALAYGDYPEFETGLDLLLADHHLRNRMGASGRAYVEAHYSWPAVLDRYERLLERVARPATASTLRLAQGRC
jgi:glycosyltransferase involved in cell wall biosynthesis